MFPTDNYTYEDAGFDQYLQRKTPVKEATILDDNTSLNIEQMTGSLEGTIKFIRHGQYVARPDSGERRGAIYLATDTSQVLYWDGIQWLAVNLVTL